MRTLRLSLTTAVAILVPATSWGFDFVPTATEFAVWPKYCQARYVESNIGGRSEFASLVSMAERRAAEANVGSDTYLSLHHHCAGLAWLNRAKAEPDPQRRRYMLNQARAESGYTLRHLQPSSPLYSSVLLNLAQVEVVAGNIAEAENYFDRSLQANPRDPQIYMARSVLYWQTNRMQQAREVLEDGLAATGGSSIDIHYNLGLVCLKLSDESCAVEHARAAYDAGYPLPGLKNQLRQRGLWHE